MTSSLATLELASSSSFPASSSSSSFVDDAPNGLGTPNALDGFPLLIADVEPNGLGVPKAEPAILGAPNALLLLLIPPPNPLVPVVEKPEELPNPPLEDPKPLTVVVPPNPDAGFEPADPNGEFSDEANADNPEEANAEVEVMSLGDLGVGFSAIGDLARPNGEAVEVFAKPVLVVDVDGACRLVDEGFSSPVESVGISCV